MKLTRKRKDLRLPHWLLDLLEDIQVKYQLTFTEALIRTSEKGINYYQKQWAKMYGKKNGQQEKPADQRCPNTDKENIPQEREEVSDEKVIQALNELFPEDKDNAKTNQ